MGGGVAQRPVLEQRSGNNPVRKSPPKPWDKSWTPVSNFPHKPWEARQTPFYEVSPQGESLWVENFANYSRELEEWREYQKLKSF